MKKQRVLVRGVADGTSVKRERHLAEAGRLVKDGLRLAADDGVGIDAGVQQQNQLFALLFRSAYARCGGCQ